MNPPVSNGNDFNNFSAINTTNNMNLSTSSLSSSTTPSSAPMGQPHSSDWRSIINKQSREELIAKIYNELIRATGEAPGPNVWMKASNYELKLFHECSDQEGYYQKISRRLYLLQQRPTLMNPLLRQLQHYQQQQQTLMQQQQAAAQMSMGGGGGAAGYNPMAMGMQQPVSSAMGAGGMMMGDGSNTMQDNGAAFWAKHAELKAKHWEDCVAVYTSFRRYVEAGQPENEQSRKLKNLLQYIQHVVMFLNKNPAKDPPMPMDEITKAEAYIHKIVIPYLRKINDEKSKKGSGGNAGTTNSSQPTTSMGMSFGQQAQQQQQPPATSSPSVQGFFSDSFETNASNTSNLNFSMGEGFSFGNINDTSGADTTAATNNTTTTGGSNNTEANNSTDDSNPPFMTLVETL